MARSAMKPVVAKAAAKPAPAQDDAAKAKSEQARAKVEQLKAAQTAKGNPDNAAKAEQARNDALKARAKAAAKPVSAQDNPYSAESVARMRAANPGAPTGGGIFSRPPPNQMSGPVRPMGSMGGVPARSMGPTGSMGGMPPPPPPSQVPQSYLDALQSAMRNPPPQQSSLQDAVRGLGGGMGGMGMKKGGAVKAYAKGGKVSSASSRGDGIAQRGKTKGKFV